MDFATLDVGVQPAARQETAFPLELPQFKNGNGKPLSVTVLAFTSPEGRKELRKWQLRFGLLAKDHSASTEAQLDDCLLYTSPSPRDKRQSRMPSSA